MEGDFSDEDGVLDEVVSDEEAISRDQDILDEEDNSDYDDSDEEDESESDEEDSDASSGEEKREPYQYTRRPVSNEEIMKWDVQAFHIWN